MKQALLVMALGMVILVSLPLLPFLALAYDRPTMKYGTAHILGKYGGR